MFFFYVIVVNLYYFCFKISNTKSIHGLDLHPSPVVSNHTCSRRHLQVTFKDLGWSNWIVAPLQFDVDYCAGSCSLPVPQVSIFLNSFYLITLNLKTDSCLRRNLILVSKSRSCFTLHISFVFADSRAV